MSLISLLPCRDLHWPDYKDIIMLEARGIYESLLDTMVQVWYQ